MREEINHPSKHPKRRAISISKVKEVTTIIMKSFYQLKEGGPIYPVPPSPPKGNLNREKNRDPIYPVPPSPKPKIFNR